MNIGFVSYWFERGQAYVTQNVIQAIEQDCEVFVFARSDGVNPIGSGGEWDIPNLTKHEQYQIPFSVLKKWIMDNDIDLVFFNEEYDFDLVAHVRDMGVATMGIYYWELFNPGYVAACNAVYDAIICPTLACFQKFVELGVKNIHHVKWGVDLDVFKPIEREPNEVVRFFHPAGWGGLHGRRGTEYVKEAFKLMECDAELLIHAQYETDSVEGNISMINGTVSREMLVEMYQQSDTAVLPSKWEGLGLTFLEAIECGLPIITIDAPPMNEFVAYGKTGYCCDVASLTEHRDIFVRGMVPDMEDLAQKMDAMTGNLVMSGAPILEAMRESTIARRSEWDWKENSKPLRDLILELGEKRRKAGTSADLDNITRLIQNECSPDTLPEIDTREYARFHKILADPMVKGDILDMGCKHGTLTKMLYDTPNTDWIVGADFNIDNIAIASRLALMGYDIPFFKADVGSLPFTDESFDTIILAQVLEHIENPDDLKELMRVLRPDGCLIITTNVGFAHWDPDHKWFFLPDSTYEMLRGGWFFMEQNNAPAFMKQKTVVPFGAFIEKYLGGGYGYQVYNNHESQYHSLEIYARVYKTETVIQPFPEIDGDEVIEEELLSREIEYQTG